MQDKNLTKMWIQITLIRIHLNVIVHVYIKAKATVYMVPKVKGTRALLCIRKVFFNGLFLLLE